MTLLAALDANQRQVAEQLRGPVCVLAGAGTGKTRAITYRIAHGMRTGTYQPNSVLAVTFTARAAGEMRARLRDLGVRQVSAATFHSAALRQLRYFWGQLDYGTLPQIISSKYSLVGQAASNLGITTDRALIRDLAAEVEWAKVQMVGPADYPRAAARAGRASIGDTDPETIASLLQVYDGLLHENGVMDFEDVLLSMVGLLTEHSRVANTVRSQYRYFVVDEYQDVSPLQQRLLELWLGDRDDLCVVGDVSQTIYSFAGANAGYLANFTDRYPTATKVELVRDYRSTPQVVDIANRLLTVKGRMPAGAVRLQAQRPSSAPVQFHQYDDDAAEATAVARQIRTLVDEGVPLSEIAILFRTNTQSQAFEAALAKENIGYQVRNAERFFDRPEIRQALVLMRGRGESDYGAALPDQVRTLLSPLGWAPQAPEHMGAARERWEALNSLVLLAEDMQASRGASLADFIAELEDRAANQHAPTQNGVTLATLHAAKGLEWDAVFLVGLSEGLMPISMAKEVEEIAEERRLLYVGVTRAREHLRLTYAASRGGGRGNRSVSRFLTGIWPTDDDAPAPAKPKSRRQRQAELQEELSESERDLFERLRQWRAQQAEAAQRPAFTVFHDSTLLSIARAQPTTLKQLALLRGIGATKLDAYGAEILQLINPD